MDHLIEKSCATVPSKRGCDGLQEGLASVTRQLAEAGQNYQSLSQEQENNRRSHLDLDSRIKVGQRGNFTEQSHEKNIFFYSIL